jgi:hypothetical protein
MVLARCVPLVLVLSLGVAACGSSGKPTTDERLNLTTPKAEGTATPSPGATEPVTRREATVIRGWSNTLRHGHVARAARYFALPSIVANGTPPLSLRTRAQAEQFNRVLTCGAKVVSLKRTDHHRVLATFRLTDRPGGDCGIGKGNLAYTAFRIRGGRITQWLRIPGPSDGAPTTPS